MWVVRPWHRLHRAAVDVPSLAVPKARLDGALGSLGWREVSLPMAGGWSRGVFEVCNALFSRVAKRHSKREIVVKQDDDTSNIELHMSFICLPLYPAQHK